MNSRERLMATLRGEPVDRPAVSFYEIGGWKKDLDDPDPFNVYNDPSWRPLLELALDETDLIQMEYPKPVEGFVDPLDEIREVRVHVEDGSKFTQTRIRIGNRTLESVVRRDPDVDTPWVIEHLLKDTDDLQAYLSIPDDLFAADGDVSNMIEADEAIGDRGIVMMDTGDPLCSCAHLFSMEDYTVVALTEQEMFHALLEKHARYMLPFAEKVAREFPGHLWRIFGPEYAAEPFLPPRLFEEYVVRYTGPMVQSVLKYGGFPRIHSHGRLRNILPHIVKMGTVGLDPVEPPHQGDMELWEVRELYGKDLVLFGNLEITDIENVEPSEFEKIVQKALREGTSGDGRGFVLMPSASPYGRTITERTLANYRTMVRLAKESGPGL